MNFLMTFLLTPLSRDNVAREDNPSLFISEVRKAPCSKWASLVTENLILLESWKWHLFTVNRTTNSGVNSNHLLGLWMHTVYSSDQNNIWLIQLLDSVPWFGHSSRFTHSTHSHSASVILTVSELRCPRTHPRQSLDSSSLLQWLPGSPSKQSCVHIKSLSCMQQIVIIRPLGADWDTGYGYVVSHYHSPPPPLTLAAVRGTKDLECNM